MPLRLFPPTPSTRQVKRLDIQADIFVRILKGMDGKRRIKSEGLPDQVRCVGITVDEKFNTVTLWLESPEWPHVIDGYTVPSLDVTFTEYFDGAS